ncbi:TIGR03086 family metal-binding protein [Nocardia sp. NBC_01327]|uniref:TIGR03086 family metal-binding protein n=1 Tax=Nocardia sp. NBC_01327 TaxID=2903593 RepID=UPI002E0E2304|nr:TIGR03086 family metal-binding protein [Nocardia sp. NBC_01327]
MNKILSALTECAAEAARVAREIRPGQLSGPTPCTEFDTRALINHWVLYSSYGLECRALRQAIPDELTDRDFTAVPDWAEEFAAQLDRALHAWSDPAVWEGDIDLGWATTPAADVAGMLLLELALHGWDVAAATGLRYRVSESSAATIQQIIDVSGKEYREYEMFGAAVDVADTADPWTRAVAASGRDPQWASTIRS